VFDDELTLRLGEHTFHCLNVPGHTAEQTAVHVPEEGVVFTGDNVFGHVKTFIQEGDPWEWLAALERIDVLDFDVLIPGHGEPCGHSGLGEQADVIRRWIEAVTELIEKGLDEAEAIAAAPGLVATIDPYPIGQRQFMNSDRVVTNTMRNVYRRVRGRLTGEYPVVDEAAEQQSMVEYLKGLRT
jgi:glyoxylase-like metal-dependent hydrolase (beta-lactamase superfamily II)